MSLSKTSQFIQQNKTKNIIDVALQLSKYPELDKTFIINQINGIQKAKKKLPEFYKNEHIVYPSILSMEQCSSEETAIYKSQLLEGKALVDLTGGFGVDSFYFSKEFDRVTYIEPNKELFNLVSMNFKSLEANNISTVNLFAEDFLDKSTQKFDVAYIDPSRRDETKRVFKLDECVPNIVELSEVIFSIAGKILIKTAPFLDIKQSINELKYVSKIFVIALHNECKEVLYLLENKVVEDPIVETINLNKTDQVFNFRLEEELELNSRFLMPQDYLYEPNVAILKAGAFNAVGDQYNLNKIASNSHLYTGTNLLPDFPGRAFKVKAIINYNLKEFRKLGIKQANVTCRNFLEKPEGVKKKLKLKDGGNDYIFATTDLNNKPILIYCVK